jgi:hypothetical protein
VSPSANPRTEWLSKPGGLAVRLREMRVQAYPTATAFADTIGWAKSKVSRAETGSVLLKEPEIRRWVEVCGGAPATADELVELSQASQMLWSDWKSQLRDGLAAAQGNITSLIETADRIAYFETTVVPGPLQIPAYARALLGVLQPDKPADDIDAAVTARAARWQALFDPSKRWELLMDESVLIRWPGSADMMRLQLSHIRGLIGLPNARIGVIPLRTTLEVWPATPFAVYDQLVVVEKLKDEDTHVGPVAEQYIEALGQLWGQAVEDPDGLNAMLDAAIQATI